jgi:hypothetical protein
LASRTSISLMGIGALMIGLARTGPVLIAGEFHSTPEGACC